MGKVNLEEIVSLFLVTNNLGKAEYSKVYQLGIAGIRNLNMDVTGEAKTYDIHLSRNLSGKLPTDFVNDISVNVHGDTNAGLLKDNTLRNEEDEFEDCYDSGDFGNLDFSDEPTYGTAGINWVGRYKIERESGKIFVNPDFCYSCVTLTYLAKSKSSQSGEWFVEELARDAVEAYIRWKFNLDKRSVGVYEKSNLQREYTNQKRLAKARLKNITRGQLQDSARRGTRFKAKF